MLSIGKLAAGQADYYLEQAQGSLTPRAVGELGRRGLLPRRAGGRGRVDGRRRRARSGCSGEVGGDALHRVLAGEHPATGAPLGRVLAARRAGLRPDVLGAEERERAVRHRRRSAARGDAGRRTIGRCGMRSATSSAQAAVTRRGAGGVHAIAGQRVGRGGVPASDVAGRRSAAAHARPRREPHARRRRAVVDARRPADLRAREDRRLPLRGAAAGAADARARRRVGAGAERDRRRRRRAAGGAAGVQPAAGRDRGRARAARRVGRRGGAGRGAGDAARQGLSRDAGAARAGVARACGEPRPSPRARPRRSVGGRRAQPLRSGELERRSRTRWRGRTG